MPSYGQHQRVAAVAIDVALERGGQLTDVPDPAQSEAVPKAVVQRTGIDADGLRRLARPRRDGQMVPL